MMTNKKSKLCGLAGSAVLAGVVALVSGEAKAYDLPSLNLGFTSFLDGGAPAGPGIYLTEYVQYYTSNKLVDGNGNKIPLPKTEVDAFVSLNQLIYLSKHKVGSASLGLDVIVPWLISANADDGIGHAALDAKNGIGDVLVGPFLQFDPIMGSAGPLFMHRIEFQVIAPTGEYDNTKAVQPGSNFWSFNPYWAGTLFLSPEMTASARIHYLWNGKNDDPNVAFGPGATSTRAGEAVHVNFAAEYSLTKALRLGVNGYYLKQTTDTEVNGVEVAGRREEVFGIGPGMMYSWGPEQHLFVNYYHEFGAENRPEGDRINVRYVHHLN